MMSALVRGAIFGLAALVAAPSLAQAPAALGGTWEIDSKDSRYDLSLCGDGTQFCAKLIWLGNGADSPENLPYLNTMIIDTAPSIGPNQWRGVLHLFGRSAEGTITRLDDDTVTLEGCFMVVICRKYTLHRYAS